MFDLNQVTDTFKTTVVFYFKDDKGRSNRGAFDGVFMRQSKDEMKQNLEDLSSEKISNEDFVKKFLVDWHGVREGGQPLEYTDENFNRVVQRLPSIVPATIKAYSDAVSGAKN